jgi:hypothetical protein
MLLVNNEEPLSYGELKRKMYRLADLDKSEDDFSC